MACIIEIWIFRSSFFFFLSALNLEFGEFMNLESCAFTLNMCLVIGQKSSYKEGRRRFPLQTLRQKGLRV